MPTQNRKSRATAHQKKTAHSITHATLNIWVTTGVLLIIIIAVVLLARVPLTGLETRAAGNEATVRTNKRVQFLGKSAKYSVKVDKIQQPTCKANDAACSQKLEAVVTVTNQTTGKSEQVTVQPGKPAPLPSTPTTSVNVSKVTNTNVTLTLTDTPAFQGGPTSDTTQMSSPSAQANWPAGSLQTIKWNKAAVTSQGVGIKLVGQGGTKDIAWPKTVRNANGTYSTSGGLLRNTGAFDWFVPVDMPAGSYKVQLVNGGGTMIAESGSFAIVAPRNSVRMVAPSTNQTMTFGQDFLVKWNPPKFASNIDIFIYSPGDDYNGVAYIVKNMPAEWVYLDPQGNGGYTWSISDNFLSQINGNSPTTIRGKTIYIGVSATDRSQTTFVSVQVR